MTRRRRVPLVLRVCIGVFVLLFSTAIADTTKDPSSELLHTVDASERSIFEKNRTILNKIASQEESELGSTEKKNEVVDSRNSTKKDFETLRDELTKGSEAEAKEKVPIPIDEDFEQQGIGSREQPDRLSTADSANGGSKLEETIYGTTGKSSSTKTVSEDLNRLPRTNGLVLATAKPASEEARADERKNRTIHAQRSNDTAELNASETARSPEDGLASSLKGEREASTKASEERFDLTSEVANVENEPVTRNSRFEEMIEQLQERRKKSKSPVKNSEVPDLKGADEAKPGDGSISLINDTYVNYSHHYNTSTENDPEGDRSRALENATNFISEESAVTHESDPKEEVEVVGNVTNPATQRIAERQSQNPTTKAAGLANELSQGSNLDVDSLRDQAKVDEASHANQTRVESNDSDRQQLSRITTERISRAETSALQGSSSPVPRGRTIAFSGVNEFPNTEAKPTIASKFNVSIVKKNITDRLAEQKPYPYAKSMTEQLRNNSNQVAVTTEEASAFENTIGKGQSEEKFIVTEASDVLENSIQQFKPSYYGKASNDSSSPTSTEVRSSVPMTTASLIRLGEAQPTNQTVIDKSSDSKGIPEPEEKSSAAGNDVPRWNESRETISQTGNFDVTGNGITEVSPKPDASFQKIESRTMTTPLTTDSSDSKTNPETLSKADVQTHAEGSLLLRSTLNATELSTEYSLIKGNFSDKETSASTPASPLDASTAKEIESTTLLPATTIIAIEKTFVENVTESPVAIDANKTNEIPSSVSATSSSVESLTTATSIEYEFVGLAESTTFLSRNTTEETLEGREMPTETSTIAVTVHDVAMKNVSNETTTTSDELTTDQTEATDSDDKVSSVPLTHQTIVPTSTLNPTTRSRDENATQSSGIQAETHQSSSQEDDVEKTTAVTSSWEEDTVTTIRMEQTIAAAPKDSHLRMNVTESPLELTSISSVNATDATQVATSDLPVPTGPQTRIPVSSTTSGPTASGIPPRRTDDNKMPSNKDQITSLVRIDMEGSWYDVCPKRDKLKLTLAELLSTGMKTSVSDKQIIFHQDPCQESPGSTPLPSDMPLMSILIYVVDEHGKFDNTMTTILPRLYKESSDRVKFPVTETTPDSGNAIAVVVVSSVAFICLVLLAGLLFIMRKRQTRFNYGERCRPVSLDAYSLDSVSAYNSFRRKGVARSSKRSYGNPTFEDSSAIPSHPLNFAGLSSFCNDVNAINEEFSGVPQVSAKIDELPAGAEVKNRYANVIPLPETRVPLQKINNDPLTEYINASYVRGPKNATRYYIACQAPMETTVTDFWRMIWEQQCKVIIMLTDLVENGVEKCTEYIPPSEITDCHRLYGDYQVTLKKRETKEKYAISTLHLKNLENNTFREVFHIWYLWPVDGPQSDGAGLIAVLLEARALQRGGPGPIVVHCSPGTGRTGTLIALDLGIRQYEITRTVDVPRVVYTIRRDRAGAVQTKEQYAFIYKALNLYATKLAGGVLEST
ncbi:uncharacterized protein LOC143428096 isoform X2 [Xylocopa sonorina]|uniref:uncharacterized protein LOC143428096 isoform X2 n=1 Tax=Xylocopa sonorina TaxID=1818115 RepID=UPI00403ACB58